MNMRVLLRFTNTIVLLFCCFHIVSCSDRSSDIPQVQIVTQYRTALNNNDVTNLVKLTQLPLTVIEHEWESAQDGTGFVLGKRAIVRVEKVDDLKIFYATFARRVTIEGGQASEISLSELDNFTAELADSMNQWRTLSIYLFKRGEGDVEHIVLLGINPASDKVQTIYLN